MLTHGLYNRKWKGLHSISTVSKRSDTRNQYNRLQQGPGAHLSFEHNKNCIYNLLQNTDNIMYAIFFPQIQTHERR